MRAGWFTGAGSDRTATVAAWARERGDHYLLAHRGSGDVLPEHSLPAYRAARDWGARAVEISVVITSDGVLVCMHDLTYDRTTNRRGRVAAQPSSVLFETRIVQPQLGPRWAAPPLPVVPRLDDVLHEFGGAMVLCLEAKDDAAYQPMMAMAEKHGLRDSVVVKAYRSSRSIDLAKAAGYPVFGYLGPRDLDPGTVSALAARLRPGVDYLGVPATAPGGVPLPDDVVRSCLSSGVPVWVYPVHRRSEADRFFTLGVSGAVCSSYGYVAGAAEVLERDSWATRAIASGEMTRHPEQPGLAPSWTGRDELTLDRYSRQFLTLGQLVPQQGLAGTYRVDLQVRWPGQAGPGDAVSLAFGHTDDRYFEPGAGDSTGYEAVARADGRLELRAHLTGSPDHRSLGATAGPPVAPRQWISLRLSVSPTTLTWSRTDVSAEPVRVDDRRTRGSYLHLGRQGAPAAFRSLSMR